MKAPSETPPSHPPGDPPSPANAGYPPQKTSPFQNKNYPRRILGQPASLTLFLPTPNSEEPKNVNRGFWVSHEGLTMASFAHTLFIELNE